MTEIPHAVQKQLDEANKRLNQENNLLGELIVELNQIKREHRATGILSEIYLNLECSMILASRYRTKLSNYDTRKLTTNKNHLLKLKLISDELGNDIVCIQKIRNIYAHGRSVKSNEVIKEITEWIEKTTTWQNLHSLWEQEGKIKDYFDAFMQVVNNLIKKLRRIHGQVWTDYLEYLDKKITTGKSKSKKK